MRFLRQAAKAERQLNGGHNLPQPHKAGWEGRLKGGRPVSPPGPPLKLNFNAPNCKFRLKEEKHGHFNGS